MLDYDEPRLLLPSLPILLPKKQLVCPKASTKQVVAKVTKKRLVRPKPSVEEVVANVLRTSRPTHKAKTAIKGPTEARVPRRTTRVKVVPQITKKPSCIKKVAKKTTPLPLPKRRFRPSTVALRDIRYMQRSTDLCI